ncbi:methyltransferase domain-containing protein [Spirulina subsalsa FACHB-351]|uniref:Methyltransferase domain-containing protein n=1 Tax=Spirulina subsalsa FACHB-351 TaxID=234711 RepID=A0ABT3L6T9_9CYAN|nr:class I SAM-dependent methyltransferase [Spirulina subsalsa]MCW6037214.1 methyltransferase domain-containing protein [Spirulina subsalsa FACHB-351]
MSDNKSQPINPELMDKIRQQFDFGPYPRVALEVDPKQFIDRLYTHNLTTAHYLRNQQVISSENRTILDVGCGTGFTSLILAEANPKAQVIGIDISPKSIELAQKRIEYHGKQDQCEFHVLSLEQLPQLPYEFDYINCDEVLYILPDQVAALNQLKAQLKPTGIIRANLHSYAQRFRIFQVQKMFNMMGFMDKEVDDTDIETVIDIMQSLKDNVIIKTSTWSEDYADESKRKELVIENYLFKGDKGYEVADIFNFLDQSDLEFISMINWRQWQLIDLFKEPDNLPLFLSLSLPEITIQEQLQLFEILQPIHRLLDFWCGHPGAGIEFLPVPEWSDQDWYNCLVHLHPQLNRTEVKDALNICCQNQQSFPVHSHLPIAGSQPISLEITLATCLFSQLLTAPQSLPILIEQWKRLHPVDLATLEPTSNEASFALMKKTLTALESCGYVMLERA